MEINAEKLKEVGEILNCAEDLRPIVHAVMQIIDSYSEELQKYPKAIAVFNANLTSDIFKLYIANGFSREEAMLLVLNQNLSTREALQRFGEAGKAKAKA